MAECRCVRPPVSRTKLATVVEALVGLATRGRRNANMACTGTARAGGRWMKPRDLTMTSAQYDVLRRECNVAGPQEGACQILCGSSLLTEDPWKEGQDEHPELRLTIHRVDPIPPDRVRASAKAVSWDMNCYVRLLRKAREEALHPGICHSHPVLGHRSRHKTMTTKAIFATCCGAAIGTQTKCWSVSSFAVSVR